MTELSTEQLIANNQTLFEQTKTSTERGKIQNQIQKAYEMILDDLEATHHLYPYLMETPHGGDAVIFLPEKIEDCDKLYSFTAAKMVSYMPGADTIKDFYLALSYPPQHMSVLSKIHPIHGLYYYFWETNEDGRLDK